MRDVELQPPEITARHEVGDAADRVGAVSRRRALLQYLQPADRDRRNSVHIDETPADETRGDRYVTAAVEQHERPRGAEAAQVDVGHVLGECRGLVGVVPTAPLADHAVAHAQVLEEIDELRGALLLNRVAADHHDRVGHVDRGRVDGGACHRHGHFLEQAADPQADVHRRRGRDGQRDGTRQLLEAWQCERDGVHARRQRLERVTPVHIGYNYARDAGQRGSRRCDGHARQHTTGFVGDCARNPAVLRFHGDAGENAARGVGNRPGDRRVLGVGNAGRVHDGSEKPAPAKGKPVCDCKVSIFVAPFVARKADGLFRLEPGYCQVSGRLRCLLLVMCTYPFAKKALTLHLARGEGRERYFGCNLMHRKVLASSHQHLMAEAPADSKGV